MEQNPAPRTASRPPWPIILVAAVGALALVVVVLAVLVGGEPAEPPTASASAPAASGPSGSASASIGPSPSASEDVVASEAPDAPTEWTAVAEFLEDGASYLGTDVVIWHDRFVAAGTRYAGAAWNVFGPPPPPSGRLWSSSGGASWEDATPGDTFDGVELTDLLVTSDGALVVIATRYEGDEAGAPSRSVAWESADGTSWTEVPLTGIPDGATVFEATYGAQGHLVIASDDGGRTAYHSPDGRAWTAVLDGAHRVAAGDEGFVAVVDPSDGSGPRLVASADGRAWVDGDEPEALLVAIAGIGPDWLRAETFIGDDHVYGEDPPPPATVHFSADGLAWEPTGEVAMGAIETCIETVADLATVGAHVMLSTILSPCAEGRVVLPGAAYTSAEGSAWTKLPFGDYAAVRGGAATDDRAVVIVDRGTNPGPTGATLGATIWLGPPQP